MDLMLFKFCFMKIGLDTVAKVTLLTCVFNFWMLSLVYNKFTMENTNDSIFLFGSLSITNFTFIAMSIVWYILVFGLYGSTMFKNDTKTNF